MSDADEPTMNVISFAGRTRWIRKGDVVECQFARTPRLCNIFEDSEVDDVSHLKVIYPRKELSDSGSFLPLRYPKLESLWST
jgi:hypothetical protein